MSDVSSTSTDQPASGTSSSATLANNKQKKSTGIHSIKEDTNEPKTNVTFMVETDDVQVTSPLKRTSSFTLSSTDNRNNVDQPDGIKPMKRSGSLGKLVNLYGNGTVPYLSVLFLNRFFWLLLL